MCVKPTKNEHKIVYELFTMPLTRDIFRIRPSKREKVTLTESSRDSSICLASNNTPSNPPSGPGSKRKLLPE